MAIGNRIPTRAGHLHQADVTEQPIRNTVDDPAIKRPRQRVWAFLITSAVITLGIIVFWNTVVTPWWLGIQTQWQYGSSRITQMDANVGHDGECHFIAEYYKGAIVVIEIPYANTSATHTGRYAEHHEGRANRQTRSGCANRWHELRDSAVQHRERVQ